jgi:hypothetical protein
LLDFLAKERLASGFCLELASAGRRNALDALIVDIPEKAVE